jgi:hypothetical protein
VGFRQYDFGLVHEHGSCPHVQRTILAVKQVLFELIPLLGIKVIQKIPFRGFLADCLMVIH